MDMMERVKELEGKLKETQERLRVYENSPYGQTYLTLYRQHIDMCEQLELRGDMVLRVGEDGVEYNSERGKIDIFSDKDDKSFDRYVKFKERVLKDLETLDLLRGKMSEAEMEIAKGDPLMERFGGK